MTTRRSSLAFSSNGNGDNSDHGIVARAKVLVVEDERIIALGMTRALEAYDYEVVAAVATAQEAIAKTRELAPDLVLMDIHLGEGEMDGIEAARIIHQQSRVPVIFLTAYAQDETLMRAQDSLPYGYLVKPIEVRELHATIQMALARWKAENELERSERRLTLALEAAEMGTWEWDPVRGSIIASGHSEALFGRPPEPIHESCEEFLARIHPEDREEVEAAVAAAVNPGHSLDLTFRRRTAEGSTQWNEIHGKAYPSGAGVHVVGVVRDVTARKQMAERLKLAGVVFQTTTEGIVVLDAARRIVSVNPAFSLYTGYAPEEVLGRDTEELLHARRHGDQFYARLEADGRGQWQGETLWRRKNGALFPAWENVSVVKNAVGAVTHFVVAFSDISAIRRAEEDLRRLAYHDALTELPNRLLLQDRLDQVLLQAHHRQGRCAVLFLDVDDFKVINDTLGHSAGDLMLQNIAARISQCLRRSDSAARVGGDEFVLIIPDLARAEDGAPLARKILDAITAPIELAGEQVSISASIGIAVYPDDGVDRHELLKAADAAMFHAKSRGRNSYAFYTKDMAERVQERLRIEQGLKRALELGQLALHYQPQVALEDGTVVGVEVLLRWEHAEQGLILPATFIPIAEDCGLMEPLGRWALQSACREASTWVRDGLPPLRLAVNVSARQLMSDHFVAIVEAALAASNLPAERLELEITESAMQILERSRRLLGQLKSLGVRIAIDDFGTGFSSLSLLQHLPCDRLKIDRSFVRGLPDNSSDLRIVEAIIAMSRMLGLTVTAEGVETEVQRRTLRELGCEEGQGWLFSKAVPAQELHSLIATGRIDITGQ